MLTAGDCSVGVGIWLLRQRQIGGRHGIKVVYMTRGGFVSVCLGGTLFQGREFLIGPSTARSPIGPVSDRERKCLGVLVGVLK